MDEEKKDFLSPDQNTEEPQKEPYIPATRKKRIIAWIGVILMVILVIMYTYSIATGEILNW